MNSDKPTGTYQCMACGIYWDGKETFRDPLRTGELYTCGDLCCGANVKRVSVLPKTEFLRSRGSSSDLASQLD